MARVSTAALVLTCCLLTPACQAQQSGALSLPTLILTYQNLTPLRLASTGYPAYSGATGRAPQPAASAGDFRTLTSLALTRIDLGPLTLMPLSLVTLGYAPNVVNPQAAQNSNMLQPTITMQTSGSSQATAFTPTNNAFNLGIGLDAINLIHSMTNFGNVGNANGLSGLGSLLNPGNLNLPGLPPIPTGR
ncbi:MAG: hypothetical protein ABJA67_18405 [Chthonomonadales bacterium]